MKSTDSNTQNKETDKKSSNSKNTDQKSGKDAERTVIRKSPAK
ncbi:hypothetical protein [Flavobacterium sp. Root420]|nr:hypothetical protein [Flavobacterium sp. Root420]